MFLKVILALWKQEVENNQWIGGNQGRGRRRWDQAHRILTDAGHFKELQVFNINKALDACGTAVEDKAGKVQAGQDMKNLKAMPKSVGKPFRQRW